MPDLQRYPSTRTNQSEQHSVSSIWNQTLFLVYNTTIFYLTDLFILYFFIQNQNAYADKKLFLKRLKNYVKWVKFTAFWKLTEPLNPHARKPSSIWSKLWMILSFFLGWKVFISMSFFIASYKQEMRKASSAEKLQIKKKQFKETKTLIKNSYLDPTNLSRVQKSQERITSFIMKKLV